MEMCCHGGSSTRIPASHPRGSLESLLSLLSRLVTVLLASTLSERTRSPSDLTRAFRQVYKDLERPGLVHRQLSPTIRFSYVSPPCPINGTSTWNLVDEGVSGDPLNPNESDRTQPVAVYLPGLDGYGVSACTNQFDDLARTFELWRLTILREDRSSFTEVVKKVEKFLQEEFDGRNVVLIGESCGGVFASAAALRLQDLGIIKGLVLVNPATSFDESPWRQLVPVLTSLKHLETDASDGLTPYSVVGSLLLATTIPDNDQIRRMINAVLSSNDLEPGLESLQEMLAASADGFRETAFRLPPDVLEHRVENWLGVGCPFVNARLSSIDLPALVVVGQEDKLLPSSKHAGKLVEELPKAEKLSIRGRGHFVLDESVNLTEAILYSNIDPLGWEQSKLPFDPILDWELDHEELKAAIDKTVKPMRIAHSPVFFSSDQDGRRWRGLSKIPVSEDCPLLFVGNHQFAGTDMRMFQAELFEQRRIFPRGLAHPLLFQMTPGQIELGGRVAGVQHFPPAFNSDFQKFGAVKVTPRNYYRLLQSGQDALLFPGGAKEAMSGDTSYPLRWPESKIDFVRTAARFNATIVPLSAIGMIDGVNVIAEPEDFLRIPFVGDGIESFSSTVGAARYDETAVDEPVGLPLAMPKLPKRNYFIFGPPLCLREVDPNDREACWEAYQMVKAQVRGGIDDLVRAREKDPFADTRLRLLYEQVWKKQAPTFPTECLNEGTL